MRLRRLTAQPYGLLGVSPDINNEVKNMPFAYAGSLLRINLTAKSIVSESLSRQVLHDWVGGTGLGAKIVYDEVPPSANWDAPENRLVMASGALTGTKGVGSGCFGVVTKGALTNGFATSQANGLFSAFLKFCGYDALVLEGQSPEWVYLYIDDEKVEIKSAARLLGLDTVQTQDALLEEYGLSRTQLSVACIGPAGENLVRYACIISDYGHVAAHNGVGAVLGSKKVKAIAVKRGKKKPEIFDHTALRDNALEMNRCSRESFAGKGTFEYGTNVGTAMAAKGGVLPVKNITTSIFPEVEGYTAQALRSNNEYKKRTCWGCNWNHVGDITIKSGPFAGFTTEEPEYEAMAEMGPNIGITDPSETIVLCDWVDRLGLDVNETGWVVAWVIECFEKGYFTAQDLDGLELTWGNFQNVKALIENIAYKKGCGAFLAEGIMRAATQTGGPACECANYTEKGNSIRGHDHRAMWTELLDTCVSSTGTIEVVGGFINVKQHGLEPMSNPFSWEQVARQNATVSGRRVFEDSLGVCRFMCEDINITVAALNGATGDHYTVEEVMKIGKRIMNLMRIYNLKCGLTAEKEKPSQRYAERPADGPASVACVGDVFFQMRERYYELMGWDPKTGVPLPQTLQELGLSFVLHESK